MNTEKLMILGHELQAELQFHPVDGITSREQYDEVLEIIDILTCDDATNDKNSTFLSLLSLGMTITRLIGLESD
jgi:hypothetical protein